MAAWIRTLVGSLLLRRASFDAFGTVPDGTWRGFVLILVVSLIVGLPSLGLDLHGALQVADPEATTEQLVGGMEQMLDRWAPLMGTLTPDEQEAIRDQVLDGTRMAMQIAAEVQQLPTALPRPIGDIFSSLGRWLSLPWQDAAIPLGSAVLASWLGYGVWVMLAAKLLGGRGSLGGFFGTTALFALPHTLGVFGRIPYIGGVLGFLGFAWGVVMYVRATAVSHKLGVERALLSVLLPALAGIALMALAFIALVVFAITLGGG